MAFNQSVAFRSISGVTLPSPVSRFERVHTAQLCKPRLRDVERVAPLCNHRSYLYFIHETNYTPFLDIAQVANPKQPST